MIMDRKKHGMVTQSTVRMVARIGGKFSVYGGGITGTNIRLEPEKLIVQSWQIDDEHWPKGHQSKVTFRFSKHKRGTRLNFTHSGIPSAAYEDIKSGWHEYYWTPMKTLLANT